MLPRYQPDEPLPPYSYVPGSWPHPVRGPAGHSFGKHPPQPLPLVPERWPDSRAYRVGIDLFNHGYYWEAHEAWEGLWHACGRVGKTADFLKGLIKLAAAGVKAREGWPAGVKSHSERAGELFSLVAMSSGGASARYAGLRFSDLINAARYVATAQLPKADEACPVKCVFAFVLLPVEDATLDGIEKRFLGDPWR